MTRREGGPTGRYKQGGKYAPPGRYTTRVQYAPPGRYKAEGLYVMKWKIIMKITEPGQQGHPDDWFMLGHCHTSISCYESIWCALTKYGLPCESCIPT